MLCQHHRRWTDIKPALDQRLVCAGPGPPLSGPLLQNAAHNIATCPWSRH